MKNVTLELSEFISQLSYDQISSQALLKVKSCLLDSFGCAFLGSTTPWAKIINEFIQDQRGTQEARLWSTGFLGPAANVVMGNGSMIHSLDFDDYHMTKIHPAAVVIPVAIAVGEKEHIDGKKLLTAIVAGYETMIHISRGLNPAASRLKGWHLTGTCGTFAAAAAAGKVWEFDAGTQASALGMAGTQSAGLWAFTADGSHSKRFHPGRASQSGLLAAALARKGYRGPTKVLEAGDGGFFKATSYDSDFFMVTDRLGKKFDTEDVVIKPYPACGSLHSSIEATLAIREKQELEIQKIQRINVYNSEVVNVQCGFEYKPMGLLQAQMSMKYCVARAALDGMISMTQFGEDKLSDPLAIDLAKRVHFILDKEINKRYPQEFPSRVEIIMEDGKQYSAKVDMPKGSIKNPMSWQDVCDKFETLSVDIIKRQRAMSLIELTENIENIPDISILADLLGNRIQAQGVNHDTFG